MLPSHPWGSRGARLTGEDTLPLNMPSSPAVVSSCSGLDAAQLALEAGEQQTSLKFAGKGNFHLVSCLSVLTSQRKSSCVAKSLLLAEKTIFKDLLFQMCSFGQQQQCRRELIRKSGPGSYTRPTKSESLGVVPKNWCFEQQALQVTLVHTKFEKHWFKAKFRYISLS